VLVSGVVAFEALAGLIGDLIPELEISRRSQHMGIRIEDNGKPE
jgi:hypothetical protein